MGMVYGSHIMTSTFRLIHFRLRSTGPWFMKRSRLNKDSCQDRDAMIESEEGWGESLFVDRTPRSLGRKEGMGRASCRELSSRVRCVQNPTSCSEVSTKTQ